MKFYTFLKKYVHLILCFSIIECQRDSAAPHLLFSCCCVRLDIIDDVFSYVAKPAKFWLYSYLFQIKHET